MLITTFTVLTLALPLVQDEPTGVAALFVEHCAQCHGETGNGDGWAELDRRARSFQEGGFSFGNTPEAIFRTVTMGIPGTPMPAFDGSLEPDQRRLLADYVIELGPEVREVERSDTILVVRDRPQWVRGHLPPISEGAEEHVRGLLLGLPNGLSFEYSGEDVRLLGVRAGEFVERTDWTGRGGTPLSPLGQVIWLNEGGEPGPLVWRKTEAGLTPVRARLATTIGNLLHCHLEGGPDYAEGQGSLVTSAGSGFLRVITLYHRASGEGTYVLGVPRYAGLVVDEFETKRFAKSAPVKENGLHRWLVYRREDGRMLLATVPTDDARTFENQKGLAPEPRPTMTSELAVLLPPDWNDEVRSRLLEELNQ